MDKKKKEEDSSDERFWIYEGERRPVVVQAKNARHAIHKVSQSPEYDGFPIHVYPIEDFAKRCTGAKTKTPLPPEPEPTKVYIVIGIGRTMKSFDLHAVVNGEDEAVEQVRFMAGVLKYKAAGAFTVTPKEVKCLKSSIYRDEDEKIFKVLDQGLTGVIEGMQGAVDPQGPVGFFQGHQDPHLAPDAGPQGEVGNQGHQGPVEEFEDEMEGDGNEEHA